MLDHLVTDLSELLELTLAGTTPCDICRDPRDDAEERGKGVVQQMRKNPPTARMRGAPEYVAVGQPEPCPACNGWGSA